MADKSLDQIIQERKTVGSGRGRGRGRGAFRGGGQRNAGQEGGRGGVQKRGGGNFKGQMPNRSQVIQSLMRQNTFRPNQAIAVTVPDARNKLISKARLTDAREKLNKKAKLVDVRMKLNAKRQRDPVQQVQQVQHVQQGGGDMTQVLGPETGAHLRNQGNKLPKQFTVHNPLAQKHRQMTGPTQFTISNTQALTQVGKPSGKKPTVSLGAEGLQVTTINKSAKKRQAKQQMQLQRTIPTEDTFEDELLFQPVSAKFKRITTQAVPAPQANIKTTIQDGRDLLGFSARGLGSTFQIGNVQPASALQRVASQPPSPMPVSAQGTRLIVSHLHSSVSEADIKELYGDVGPLKRARLVRSGLAEVVYIKREHALEAIARYHNRELDGLPMQCKLDTSTVPEATGLYVPVTGKRMSMSDRFKVIGGGSTGTTDFSLSSVGMRSDAMAPSSEPLDTSTVQKALFKTGGSAAVGNRPVVFTVKI